MDKNEEIPQKGNPHKLPIKLHILPVESIKRFANESGTVQIKSKKRQKSKCHDVYPKDEKFFVKRAWDARTEQGFMKSIEYKFQVVVDSVLAGNAVDNDQEKDAIERFFYCGICVQILKK